MAIAPFSSEHLRMLDHLAQEPLQRQQDAGRFLAIGEPILVAAARRAARRRCVRQSRFPEMDALTRAHIYVRILKGRYSHLDSDEAREKRILADVDNCVRAEVAKESRRRRRQAPLGSVAEALVAGDPEFLAQHARLERIERELALIRGRPGSPVDRLLMILRIHPSYVERRDVEAAVAASRVVTLPAGPRCIGITRSVDETLRLIEECVQVPLEPMARRSWQAERGALRRRLVWTLRGPPGVLDPNVWSEADWLRAGNWMDHRWRHLCGEVPPRD